MGDSKAAREVWSKPLPTIVDTLLHGAFFGIGLAAYAATLSWPLLDRGLFLLPPISALILGTLVFVWFFSPVHRLLDSDLPLPSGEPSPDGRALERARSLATGNDLGPAFMEAFCASLLAAWIASAFVRADLGPWHWFAVLAAFVVAALWGAWTLPALRLAVPVWMRRLGGSHVAILGSDDPVSPPRGSRLLGALFGVAVLLALTAPPAVLAIADTRAQVAKYGAERWVGGEERVVLSDGAELVCPKGWTALCKTGDPLDARIGLEQSVSLGSESTRDDSYISVSAISDLERAKALDPSVLVDAASKAKREAYGPEEFTYRGWTVTVAAAEDDLAMRASGVLRYSIWIRLEDGSRARIFLSTDNRSVDVEKVSEVSKAARRVIDFIELRPAQK